MTSLHAYFHLRNQQAFQRLLEGNSDRGHSSTATTAALSSSGKSYNRPSALTLAISCNVNDRDWLGRTVLHLACAAVKPSGIEYVRLLLGHSGINVNLQDTESHWTALHRALYHGNIAAAILLLQRSDTDVSLKDIEGYTAFDLYNSTVHGTKPSDGEGPTELFTWGANRNAALGQGDGDDRLYPDPVVIPRKDESAQVSRSNVDSRFLSIRARQISMSKLHTAVVTTEHRDNIRVCGFGNGGRLGPGQHTQYSFKSLPQFNYTIVSVALGQDHTLALTKSGEVLSWGLNRFHQLGYVVETSNTLGHLDEPIQAIPRKVFGALRKELVKGIAACKVASACWTDKEVFTWGTNNGQLGYDKTAQPVQVLPRKVTKVTQPVVALAATDFALVCLLKAGEVICLWNDRYSKINFPAHTFPSEIHVYRPPQAVKDAHITKVTSCDDVFAALTSNGELFTFSPPMASDVDAGLSSSKERMTIKPQRVWALKKRFSAVADVALGSDGSIIICTESGHVFVRSRTVSKKGQIHSSPAKPFKFQRVPYLQRVLQVCANSTGAFGALRMDWKPSDIVIYGNVLAEDLSQVQPYLWNGITSGERLLTTSDGSFGSRETQTQPLCPDQDDDCEDLSIQRDIATIRSLMDLLQRDKQSRLDPKTCLAFGADLMVQVQSGSCFPVHRVILGARSHVLSEILSGINMVHDQHSNVSIRLLPNGKRSTTAMTSLSFSGCHAISVLILLNYLYSDELLAIWDRRVVLVLEQEFSKLKVTPDQVKSELLTLTRLLHLSAVMPALESPEKRNPASCMRLDMFRLFHQVQTPNVSQIPALLPDVILQLADKDVMSHSIILQARSPFFASFFCDEIWTAKRRDQNQSIQVDLRHLNWRVMQFVLDFLCCGGDLDMFENLDFIHTVDELLDLMFDVIAAANELLLDRLVLLCSVVILRYCNIHNACYILTDATHFHAVQLIESVQEYMCVNLETLLESRMLDELTPDLINQLGNFICRRQAMKSPISRTHQLANKAAESHADWLAMQDIPQPIVRTNRHAMHRTSPKLSPLDPTRITPRVSASGSSLNTSSVTAMLGPLSSTGDDIFPMDDANVVLAESQSIEVPVLPAWRGASAVPRVDMRTIMAETAIARDEAFPPVARIPTTVKPASQTAPRERRNQSLVATETVVTPNASASRSSPWKVSASWPSVSHDLAITAPQAGPSSAIPSASVVRAKETSIPGGDSNPFKPSPSYLAKPPSGSPPQKSNHPHLGPVITPIRQLSSSVGHSPIQRIPSGGKAWTLPPVQPVVQFSPPGSVVSLVAIQQLQQNHDTSVMKDKRSLLEIQEEEQARQAEEDFLKWWAAEEERVKLETQESSQTPKSSRSRPPKKHRHTKDKPDSFPNTIPTTSPNKPRRKRDGHHKQNVKEDTNPML